MPAVIEKHQDYCGMTNNNETVDVTKEQEGKAYVKEYIATRRRDKSSEISKTELRKQRDQKILKKQENLKGRLLIDAKNQILIISGY